MKTAPRAKLRHYSDEHLTVAVKHFCKRLHDRFGIGSKMDLHHDIVRAIIAEDEARVRYVRDQPAKVPSSRWSRNLRQEWLVNVGDRYIVAIYCPKSRTIFTCLWPTTNVHTYRVKQQVLGGGGLLPFIEHVNKLPTARASRLDLH